MLAATSGYLWVAATKRSRKPIPRVFCFEISVPPVTMPKMKTGEDG
jgi:hypothetical protein